MAYVHPKDRDTSYYIFNSKFLCSVPYIDTRSKEHIPMFGMPTSGIREIDKETAHERIDTFLTINQMAEYFDKGALVGVKKIADTKTIYEYITNHLNAWKEQLRIGFKNGDAPIDDLMLLDRFANAVYEYAKFQFTQEIVDSLLLRQMGGIMPLNRETLISDMQKNKRRKEGMKDEHDVQPEERPKRTTLDEFFSTYQRNTTLKSDRWS